MTKRSKRRSVKARNPIAKDLRDPKFHLRLKPSKKLYQRKPKHRGRAHGTDLGSGFGRGLYAQPFPSSHAVTVGKMRSTMTAIPSGRGWS